MPDTITYTPTMRHAAQITQSGVPSLGMLMGTMAITNYQQTKSPFTGITGQFDTAAMPVSVQPDAVSSAGYHLRWDTAAGAFRAYVAGATGAADTEATNGTNIGTFAFVAFGKVPR